ncbi:uncharacterized protein TrAFT101_000595 [Trichoderma asperellum]|uniref:uncharacterized protein n=1 Tax=Trichoderma asperellum TaxID=101201 RepID=UPI0033223873|nr:hypothetical protein TrAFT101_000595 [Trichoderma asperellum]
MHVKIAALVQTSKWPPSLDAGATGTPVASHFFIVVTYAHHTTRSHWRLSLAGLAWASRSPGTRRRLSARRRGPFFTSNGSVVYWFGNPP